MSIFENVSQLVSESDYLLYDDFTVGLDGPCNGRIPQLDNNLNFSIVDNTCVPFFGK